MKYLLFVLVYLSLCNVAFSYEKHEVRMSLTDIFYVEETDNWKVEIQREMPIRLADVKVTPKNNHDFSMMLYFKCDTKDLSKFDTPEEISNSIKLSNEQYLPYTIEKEIKLFEIPIKSTYGYYCTFTDSKLANKEKLDKGEYKFITRGMYRVSRDAVLGFSIMSNDISSNEYNKLIAYVYSFFKQQTSR